VICLTLNIPPSSSFCFPSVTKDDKNAGNFADMVRAIKGSHSGTRLGFPVKDCTAHPGVEGNLASLWLKHAADKAGLAAADVARGLSSVMAAKDDSEVSNGSVGWLVWVVFGLVGWLVGRCVLSGGIEFVVQDPPIKKIHLFGCSRSNAFKRRL
jgi:hypothetical protein